MTSDGVEVATDTGVIWTCPICKRMYRLVHRQRGRKVLKHDFWELPRQMMSEEQSDEEILYEVIRKLDAVSSQLRSTPERFTDPIVLNLIGKCFQAGLYVIQYYNKSEDWMKVLEEFRKWHGQISAFIQEKRR